MDQRIKPIDGLRAFAAFGVVWIHVWTFYGYPTLHFFSIDLYKAIAIVGNGVDFFFVISGFCMYIMTYKKNFNWTNYLLFLKKRFIRIAPAYYTAIVIYALTILFYQPGFAFVYNVFFHLLFLNNVITGNTISGPFWSIGTEWHFYMILPLVIYMSIKFSIVRSVLWLSMVSFLFLCLANLDLMDYSWWEKQVLLRFPEFGIGIAAGYFYSKSRQLPLFLIGLKGILFAVVIMYLGRFMRFTPTLQFVGDLSFLFRSLSDIVMTSGFGLLMYHVITEKSFVSRFLSIRFFNYLGRISFSIYLWHSLVIFFLARYLTALNYSSFNTIAGFFLISIVTVVLSHFSYQYLEAFYFRKKQVNIDSTPIVHAMKVTE